MSLVLDSSATLAWIYCDETTKAIRRGIAGEDDLDAPSDVTNDAGEGHKSSLSPNPNRPPAQARPSQFQPGNGTNPPVREKLSAEDSASIRAQLVQEIEILPEDDLQPRAIAILKSKNRLSVVDAKLVEDAFAARMAQQEPSVSNCSGGNASVRRALRQAWELDDAAKAEKLIRNLAQRLERDAPGVAKSILEGLDEILTVSRLGLPAQLRRSLACTNIIENMMGTVRRVTAM